jgi:hypothetical protein
MTRLRILILAVYITLVVLAVVHTAPDIMRGEDGMEYTALLLLGLPSSFVLMVVFGLPTSLLISQHAGNWASLIGLLISCGCNCLLIMFYGKRSRRIEQGAN